MKIAIIGSRVLTVENLEDYICKDCREIVSGGANGIDKCAEKFARERGLKMTVFLPDYQRYGRGAPIVRNKEIVDYSNEVVAFWDGVSKGTKSVIDYCAKSGKKCTVIRLQKR